MRNQNVYVECFIEACAAPKVDLDYIAIRNKIRDAMRCGVSAQLAINLCLTNSQRKSMIPYWPAGKGIDFEREKAALYIIKHLRLCQEGSRQEQDKHIQMLTDLSELLEKWGW